MLRTVVAFSCASLVSIALVPVASGHVTPVPAFAPAGDTTRVRLIGPNERSEPMTAFAVVAPEGLTVTHAHPSGEWRPTIEGAVAVWSGDSLSEGEEATFEFDLEVDGATTPGRVELVAEQRYPTGSVVRWPVPLTVTPAGESPSQHLALAAFAALLGALLLAGVAALVLRRRAGSLSES